MNGYGCVRVRVRVCRVWMLRVRSHRQTWRLQLSLLKERCEWLCVLCVCVCVCLVCMFVYVPVFVSFTRRVGAGMLDELAEEEEQTRVCICACVCMCLCVCVQ